MKKTYLLLFIGLSLILSGAARGQTYKSKNLESAKLNHNTMAILPAFVTEKDKTAKARKENKDGTVATDENKGYQIQSSLYKYFFTKKPKKIEWTVRFQQPDSTNQMLRDAGVNWLDIQDADKGELAATLGVDAVIYIEVERTKTVSQGEQMAISMISGANVPSGNVTITTFVFDGPSSENVWYFKKMVPTDYWYSNSTDYVMQNIMERVVKQFPWSKKVKKK